ncbi:hypothetical protein [Luteimonas sp. RC10]|uniref:hypothetical protein n=1 Tax=Luteimonas sp. RC10 TaxID=2587035 RepID=UPI001615BA39|nr:hypothetical protein [Luteimonas sp. RC10]MBB3344742.1 hypothetical protein [Luteimonas sp. RC10]
MKMPDRRLPRIMIVSTLALVAAALLYRSLLAPESLNVAAVNQALSSREAISAGGNAADATAASLLPVASRPAAAATVSTHLDRSATQDFRDANQCVMAIRRIALAEHQVGLCNRVGEEDVPDVAAFCERRLALIRTGAPADQARLSSCISLDPGEAEQRNFEHTMRAAELGDLDAQICYVNSDFVLQRPWTAQEHRDYADRAPRYVEAALSRGDWLIVEVLRAANLTLVEERGLLFQITTGDQLTIYKTASLGWGRGWIRHATSITF